MLQELVSKPWLGGLVLMMTLASEASAQWNADSADFAGRHGAWSKWTDNYAPGRAVGISSLAFDSQDTLYLCCEKFPGLIVLDRDGRTARLDHLQGLGNDVDIEAMSIHGDKIYLCDEDEKSGVLYLYAYPVGKTSPLERISISVADFGIDAKEIMRKANDSPTDYRSLEGLVVSDRYFGGQAGANGPYFYLLDELDKVGNGFEARVYCGVRRGDQLIPHGTVVRFPMSDDFRLSELFQHEDSLYVLMTSFDLRVYKVMHCDLVTGKLKLACEFSTVPMNAKFKGFDSNYEGAAVDSKGRLFLAADNESYSPKELEEARNDGIVGPPPRANRRGITPLIAIPK